MPRSSDSLSTVTSMLSTGRSTPVIAARMPMRGATHEAAAARKYHPGEGMVAPPPMPFGMSVVEALAAGPVHLDPEPRREAGAHAKSGTRPLPGAR